MRSRTSGKDGQNPAEAEKYPFGSIFWHNSARCTWFIKDAESTTEANELGHTNVESLERIVRRQKNVFTKVAGSDGIQRITLVERRAS